MVKTPPKSMTPREYEAWCEWRKWCSVFRVCEPHPTEEEIQWGKEDDKTPDERKFYYDYLSSTIHKVFLKRLKHNFSKDQLPEAYWPTLTDAIMCFDNYMKGTKAKEVKGFTGRSYKEHLFYLISQKSSSAGQTIFGWVLGKNRCSCINTAAAQYVARTMQLERGRRGGIPVEKAIDPVSGKEYKKRIYRSLLTLDDSPNADHSDGGGLYDILADTGPAADFIYAVRECCDNLTREEKLILVASPCRLLNHPRLLQLIGWGDEKITKTKNDLFRRLKKELLAFSGDNWECREFVRLLYSSIISDLRSEKETESFLLDVVEQKEGK